MKSLLSKFKTICSILLVMATISSMILIIIANVNPLHITSELTADFTNKNPITYNCYDGSVTFTNVGYEVDDIYEALHVTFDYEIYYAPENIKTKGTVKAFAKCQSKFGKIRMYYVIPVDIQFPPGLGKFTECITLFSRGINYLQKQPIYKVDHFDSFLLNGVQIKSTGMYLGAI